MLVPGVASGNCFRKRLSATPAPPAASTPKLRVARGFRLEKRWQGSCSQHRRAVSTMMLSRASPSVVDGSDPPAYNSSPRARNLLERALGLFSDVRAVPP